MGRYYSDLCFRKLPLAEMKGMEQVGHSTIHSGGQEANFKAVRVVCVRGDGGQNRVLAVEVERNRWI